MVKIRLQTGSWYFRVRDLHNQVKRPGEWITGSGWHQDKWTDSKEGFHDGFPVHGKLSMVTPDNPVGLSLFFSRPVFFNSELNNLSCQLKRNWYVKR